MCVPYCFNALNTPLRTYESVKIRAGHVVVAAVNVAVADAVGANVRHADAELLTCAVSTMHLTPLKATIFLCLKGVCHEIFDLQFFHDSNPSGPLINRLKCF